jgi:hypothetical protein
MNHRNTSVFQAIKVYTANFFEPFGAMQTQEDDTRFDGMSFSPWMIAGNLTLSIGLVKY